MNCAANIRNFFEKNAMHCVFLIKAVGICKALQILTTTTLLGDTEMWQKLPIST